MTAETTNFSPVPVTIDAMPSAHALVDRSKLRALARRSDRRGLGQLAVHVGCMGATGTLVWLTLPVWYLLVPAMVLHGITIVTMFAPMHEPIAPLFPHAGETISPAGAPAC